MDRWRRREFGSFLAIGNMKASDASTMLGLFGWMPNSLMIETVYPFVSNSITIN